ncbi:hypothetical protein BOW53_13915 [Solemya pervernicosa gill symbiont]|uniref:Uncharacterized protein n=2 Tax=Gammaproteobacteria incertae sedis TaxID=118884 RepID=A0A1T2L171_9GAMM|nr:hypothetical protein [Candidatus Reidiella endopervernicosa]OOZ38848.1 hypothetical protein BOW53_13915 [Solemya pervernicosa gill symbiont]QKQ26571.1 hypothetical protein HUE57_09975 [Candidatus Reidiella endopervernicosa]
MARQVQVNLDQAVYDRLLELQVAPYSDINAVIDRLLFHSGHKSREVQQLEADEQHFSTDEELKRDRDGVYVSSGISS